MNHTILIIIIITVFQKDKLLEDDRQPRYSSARGCSLDLSDRLIIKFIFQ